MTEHGPAEVSRVTIVKGFDAAADPEDVEQIRTEYSDGLTLIDALGMLTFALLNCADDYRRNAEEGDDD